MQKKHPIIAITGASGAGTTVVQQAFKEIFHRLGIKGVFVEGDSFLKYDQEEMCRLIDSAEQEQKSVTTYGSELNAPWATRSCASKAMGVLPSLCMLLTLACTFSTS